MISRTQQNHRFWMCLILLVAVMVAAQGGAYLVLKTFGILERGYSNLVINAVFMLACIGCVRLFKLSIEDLGLKIIPQRLTLHVGLSLGIFTLYWLYYLLVVRIAGLRPFTSATMWGLLNYLVVAFAEEIYFRGLLYHVIEERYSGRVAGLVSGLLFGLVHFRQGPGMLPKFFTGWLWGSVRYVTGMITLLIFPIHFTYNAVWLLFNSNWENPSILAYLFPLIELLTAILILSTRKKSVPGISFSLQD